MDKRTDYGRNFAMGDFGGYHELLGYFQYFPEIFSNITQMASAIWLPPNASMVHGSFLLLTL